MLEAGVKIHGHEPLLTQWLNEWDEKKFETLNKRFHEKLWIVDEGTPNEILIAGGMNIGNEYFRVSYQAKKKWRDQDILLKGRIVSDAAFAFKNTFNLFEQKKNEKLSFADSVRTVSYTHLEAIVCLVIV